MPLTTTAKKYADVLFAKAQEGLLKDYQHRVGGIKTTVGDALFANKNHIRNKITAEKRRFIVQQLKARGEILERAYEKDGKPLDIAAAQEIMNELKQQADTSVAACMANETGQVALIAQRTRRADSSESARLNALKRELMRDITETLSGIRQALEAKIYETELQTQQQPSARRPKRPPGTRSEWHEEIEAVSRHLFNDGHYRQAVLDSYIKVIDAVKKKSGIADDGDGLMNKALGCDNRTPKIQFNALQTQAEIDEQRGIMYLFKGVVAMRNFKAHTVSLLDDPDRAKEYVGLASLLMRLLDIAKVNP